MGIARKGVGVSTLAQMFWDQIFRGVIWAKCQGGGKVVANIFGALFQIFIVGFLSRGF